MTIDLKLDTRSISELIGKLSKMASDNVVESVAILCDDGAVVANAAYGSMAKATGFVEDRDNNKVLGKIVATGKNEDELLIAEFGAGDATITPGSEFETNSLDAWVFPGAYSLFKGSMDYWLFHHWQFGGTWYTEVPARRGLFNAKQYIKEHYMEVLKGVMHID